MKSEGGALAAGAGAFTGATEGRAWGGAGDAAGTTAFFCTGRGAAVGEGVAVGVGDGSAARLQARGNSAQDEGEVRSIRLQAPIAMLFRLRTMSYRVTGTGGLSNGIRCAPDPRAEK